MTSVYFPYTFFQGKVVKTGDAIGTHITYNEDQLKKITLDLTRRNNPKTDTYMRPFAYAGSTNLSPNLERDGQFDFALYMMPLGEYLSIDKGLSAMVSSWRRSSDNAIPARGKISGSYINSALARKEAKERGFDEAIMLAENGHVCEGSAENIFIVRDGVLITPPATDDILEGITRRTILQLAKDLGVPTDIRSIDCKTFISQSTVGKKKSTVSGVQKYLLSKLLINIVPTSPRRSRGRYLATVRGVYWVRNSQFNLIVASLSKV